MSLLVPNEKNDYYWNLILKEGRVLSIPPSAVALVQKRMTNREPILTTHETIPFSEIKGFEKSSKRFTDMKVLEEAARAFKEPIITEDNAIKARWMKKDITRAEYDRKASKSGIYRFLGESDGMVTVAMVIPTHAINLTYMNYCTEEEEARLGI